MNADPRDNARFIATSEWLDELARVIAAQIKDVECFRIDASTLSLALGMRVVTAHCCGRAVLLAPTFALGTAIRRQNSEQIQHLEMFQFELHKGTVPAAAEFIIAHLASSPWT